MDCVDESEVLTAADEAHHIDKRGFAIPFVCGAQDLGEALRRVSEGAAMIRLKGNAGTGNVMNAVRHARAVFSEIGRLQAMRDDEIFTYAKEKRVSIELVEQVKAAGRLPVVTFAAGGLATPADVAMLMSLGVDGVFVGSGISRARTPRARARDGRGVHPLPVARDRRARLREPRQGDGRPPSNTRIPSSCAAARGRRAPPRTRRRSSGSAARQTTRATITSRRRTRARGPPARSAPPPRTPSVASTRRSTREGGDSTTRREPRSCPLLAWRQPGRLPPRLQGVRVVASSREMFGGKEWNDGWQAGAAVGSRWRNHNVVALRSNSHHAVNEKYHINSGQDVCAHSGLSTV